MTQAPNQLARTQGGAIAKTGGRIDYNEVFAPKRGAMEAVLKPLGIDVDRFMKQAAIACQRNYDRLAPCSHSSVLMSVIQGAELGLDFTPAMGEAYLVPYGKECTLQVGYRGLIKLATRSGRVRMIEARCVYEHDEFLYELGTTPYIKHVPAKLGQPRGDLLGAYAVAILSDGTRAFEIMDHDEIEAIRKRSRSGNSGPWVTDRPEMFRKTPTRKLCKYLTGLLGDAATGLAKALETDNDLDVVSEQPGSSAPADGPSLDPSTAQEPEPSPPPRQTRTAQVKDRLRPRTTGSQTGSEAAQPPTEEELAEMNAPRDEECPI